MATVIPHSTLAPPGGDNCAWRTLLQDLIEFGLCVVVFFGFGVCGGGGGYRVIFHCTCYFRIVIAYMFVMKHRTHMCTMSLNN